jgi:class 3 adenylate cyclase
MERRLAAILAADVVGYSRLMELDEAGTFARLRAHRKELLEPEIAAHHGRIFKLMGDGLLAEFASVVDAVECAVALQNGMVERNAAALAEHHIDARIGVNLGDVIVEKDEAGTVDMHGEGVIIANRLQALAEPGGICVSQTVVNHVGHKIAVGFEFSGEQRVKNIAEPVRVYRVLTEREAAGRLSEFAGLPGAGGVGPRPLRCWSCSRQASQPGCGNRRRNPPRCKPRRRPCRTSHRSRYCRSQTSAMIRSRPISPTASRKT